MNDTNRPGLRTTEFAITVLVTIAALVPALGLPEAHWAVKIAGLIVALGAQFGYTAQRTSLKIAGREEPKAPEGPQG